MPKVIFHELSTDRVTRQLQRDVRRRLTSLLPGPPSFHLFRSSAGGLEVVERIAIEVPPNAENAAYLRATRDKLGHLFGTIEGT